MSTLFFYRALALCLLFVALPSIGSNSSSIDIERIAQEEHEYKEPVLDVVIIGTGPAGASALLYCARAKIHALALSGHTPHGQLSMATVVENWPGVLRADGTTLMQTLQEQAERYGGVIVDDTVEAVDFSVWPRRIYTASGKVLQAFTVVIATGASSKKLNVPGEDEYWGRGVHKCALCDAPCLQEWGKEPDKHVIVVGGGDSAVEEAIQIAPYAQSVTILVRKNRMRAAPTMQERLVGYPKIKLLFNKEIEEVIGNGNFVTTVRLIDSTTGERSSMPVDAVFLAIGSTPCSEFVKDAVELDRNGYIVVNPRTLETSCPGVFAAGDVEDYFARQAIVALGHGGFAALQAITFLQDHGYSDVTADKLSKRRPPGYFLILHIDKISECQSII